MSRRRRCVALAACAAALLAFAQPRPAAADMRGPGRPRPRAAPEPLETSSVALAAEAFLGLYRSRVSPLTAGRCGFTPSCSTYGLEAFRRLGPVAGGAATGDRLMRCNVFKSPREYTLLPTGRLWDPLEDNLP